MSYEVINFHNMTDVNKKIDEAIKRERNKNSTHKVRKRRERIKAKKIKTSPELRSLLFIIKKNFFEKINANNKNLRKQYRFTSSAAALIHEGLNQKRRIPLPPEDIIHTRKYNIRGYVDLPGEDYDQLAASKKGKFSYGEEGEQFSIKGRERSFPEEIFSKIILLFDTETKIKIKILIEEMYEKDLSHLFSY